jgi:hypothetical protein
VGYLLLSILKLHEVCAAAFFFSLCCSIHRSSKGTSWLHILLLSICEWHLDYIDCSIFDYDDLPLVLWIKLLFISSCSTLLHCNYNYCKIRGVVKHRSPFSIVRQPKVSVAWVHHCFLPHPLSNHKRFFDVFQIPLTAWRLLPNYKKVLNTKTADLANVLLHESKRRCHHFSVTEESEQRNTGAVAFRSEQHIYWEL